MHSAVTGSRPRHGLPATVLTALVLAMGGATAWFGLGPLAPGSGVRHAMVSRFGPPSGQGAADLPLGYPALQTSASESYRFLGPQGPGGPPATFDSCRPIHYVVRALGEPSGGRALIEDGISRVSATTGLQFVFDGNTEERPTGDRESYQPERYGDRWAPVLIAWVTPEQEPDVATDIAGRAGSTSVRLGAVSTYVTGQVELNLAFFRAALHQHGGQEARAVLLHELGHLVGLDHVEDANQLMYPLAHPGFADYQPGDLSGLAALHRTTCSPNV